MKKILTAGFFLSLGFFAPWSEAAGKPAKPVFEVFNGRRWEKFEGLRILEHQFSAVRILEGEDVTDQRLIVELDGKWVYKPLRLHSRTSPEILVTGIKVKIKRAGHSDVWLPKGFPGGSSSSQRPQPFHLKAGDKRRAFHYESELAQPLESFVNKGTKVVAELKMIIDGRLLGRIRGFAGRLRLL